ASLSLRFVIIGGSIAGLACACALQDAGHQVRVLEKSSGSYTGVAGGVRSPPNMTRILNGWGLGPYLADVALSSRGITFKLSGNGDHIGTSLFHQDIMQSLGAEYMFIAYSDLHNALYTMALEAGAVIQYNAGVISIDPYTASVHLEGGAVIEGDIIIAANGFDSFVRPLVAGCCPQESTIKFCEANSCIPAERMRDDENLAGLLHTPELSIWMGDGHAVWGHPVHHKDSYAVVIAWPTKLDIFNEDFGTEMPLEVIDFKMNELDKSLCDLLSLAQPLRPTLYKPHKGEALGNLVHESGKVILVGHAAHPLPPNGTQNTALVIEDAAALGTLFAHLSSHDQIPSLVSAFEEIRLPRSADVIKSEIGKLEAVALPHGASEVQAKGLSSALSMPLTSWDDDIENNLRAEWEELIRMFNYDANEVAEDWWVTWGSIMEHSSPPID
ncbi:FAD/NAD P-binding domain-containing protein, partial [Gloeophyllum trabeum ATCC 11539]